MKKFYPEWLHPKILKSTSCDLECKIFEELVNKAWKKGSKFCEFSIIEFSKRHSQDQNQVLEKLKSLVERGKIKIQRNFDFSSLYLEIPLVQETFVLIERFKKYS